ncbi:acyl-CoA dehydratase activase [Anaeromicrobium sediminis]|uniref:CoA activase n=1 Tax=Anaeromicrobium sediminis TaxID=1478221 RepID=A0A267MMA9_9FIRM|nr:acyl-CoA dehydratase activase [Anaeromicrobium sediminis]PAB60676.1 CoA activase [Anaeromicrobium sediminis]
MNYLGIDIGYSTVKLALIDEEQQVKYSDYRFHKGKLKEITSHMIDEVCKQYDKASIGGGAITGSGKTLLTQYEGIESVNEVTALVEGALLINPQVGSIVELGGQSAKYITNIEKEQKSGMSISINSNCSAGTGSFLEEQIHRLELNIDDYSKHALRAKSIPRIAGRCSVFAKTDIIHHQQEGVPVEDVLLGLAYAVAKNYRSTIIRKSPLIKPVLFLGGVAHNEGMVQALSDVLKLDKEELIIPQYFDVTTAIGSAVLAAKEGHVIKWDNIFKSMEDSKEGLILDSGLNILDGLGRQESENKHVIKSQANSQKEKSFLGIDIGSTSTNLVIMNENNDVIAYRYVKTLGDPINTVKGALTQLMDELSDDYIIHGIGTTGSGRYLIGKKLGATVIKDEITAQATATLTIDPEIDTIIEIGGQDSKFIVIENGAVKDFQMNKICAAGTGAFIEEQAKKLAIPINEFGNKALSSKNLLNLGERCTVFIESSIMEYLSKGAQEEDIAAGLCYSVAKNYLHKVVGQKKIGSKISFQGGVAYNQGVVNAFKELTGKPIHILPFFSVTGAFGVGRLAANASEMGNEKVDSLNDILQHLMEDEHIENDRNNELAVGKELKDNRLNDMFLKGYTGKRDPLKKTVGIPRVLFLYKLFPAFNIFFKELGFNTVLTDMSNEETVALSQEYAAEDTCYPIKLVHGHVAQLIQEKVDYIFLPSLLTMKHEISKSRRDYGCVYMQSVSKIIQQTMNLDDLGIGLLAPVLSFEFGKAYMMKTMLELGKQLGKSKVATMMALQKGMRHLGNYMKAIEEIGQEKVNSLKPDERAFVIITRAYGIIDPILNMGIPEKLSKMGHKVLTLSHLPAHDVDLSEEYPNMYWPFGQHMISGAQIIKNHPNLYAVYLTNHGCGPDTIISKYFEEEMGDKPYLHIEVDEHASAVGVVTRIEAFINSLDQHKKIHEQPKDLMEYPKLLTHEKVNIKYDFRDLDFEKVLYIPHIFPYSKLFEKDLNRRGIRVKTIKPTDKQALKRGLAYITTKETFSLTTLIGDVLEQVDRCEKEQNRGTFLIPKTLGSEVQGQYNRVIRNILDKEDKKDTHIYAPFIEDIIYDEKKAKDTILLLLAGDLINLAPVQVRDDYLHKVLNVLSKEALSFERIIELSKEVGKELATIGQDKPLLALGEPLVLFNDFLNQNTLYDLEKKGHLVRRAPLSEYVLVLWSQYLEQPQVEKLKVGLKNCLVIKKMVMTVHKILGDHSPFLGEKHVSEEPLSKHYVGSGGRYRMMKSQDTECYRGIITLSSMYENTGTIIQILQSRQKSKLPILNLSFDGTVNETLNTKIESFMYYLK